MHNKPQRRYDTVGNYSSFCNEQVYTRCTNGGGLIKTFVEIKWDPTKREIEIEIPTNGSVYRFGMCSSRKSIIENPVWHNGMPRKRMSYYWTSIYVFIWITTSIFLIPIPLINWKQDSGLWSGRDGKHRGAPLWTGRRWYWHLLSRVMFLSTTFFH